MTYLEFPEVTAGLDAIRRAAARLEAGGGLQAGRLRSAVTDIESGNRFAAKEAFREVGKMCHPKCLGDTYLEGVSHEEWDAAIDALEEAAAAAFARLESGR